MCQEPVARVFACAQAVLAPENDEGGTLPLYLSCERCLFLRQFGTNILTESGRSLEFDLMLWEKGLYRGNSFCPGLVPCCALFRTHFSQKAFGHERNFLYPPFDPLSHRGRYP